ncbi:MAG: hypothetical protein JWP37_1003 [Mucilaginibacter sp.]|nr:hypothetical protein [Mucilaginibacter sp.]
MMLELPPRSANLSAILNNPPNNHGHTFPTCLYKDCHTVQMNDKPNLLPPVSKLTLPVSKPASAEISQNNAGHERRQGHSKFCRSEGNE